MKITKILLSISFLAFCISCNETPKEMGTSIGNLYISNTTPVAGETLNITYTSDAEEKDVSAYYYYMVGSKAYPVDINLTKADSVYNATIAIPDSATVLAINFKNGKDFDHNNKKGYIFPLTNTEGDTITGAMAGVGMYQLRYASNFGIEVDKASAINLMKDDLLKNTAIQENWDAIFPRNFIAQNKEEGKKYIESRIASYTTGNDLTENQYRNLGFLYQTNGQGQLLDSLQKVMKEKFPKGAAAQEATWMEFYKEQDYNKKKEIYTAFEANFGTESRIRDMMLTRLADAAIKNNNKEEYTSLMAKVFDKKMLPSAYNSIAWEYAEKGENLDFAAEISKKSLDLVSSSINNLSDKPEYYTASQYKQSMKSTYNMYADTYALIMFKQGNVDEAITYQKEAIGKGLNPELNERYIQFLMAAKKYDDVVTEAGNYIKTGNTTTKINDYYKEAYINKNGSTEGFQKDFDALEKIAYDILVAKTKAEMIDKTPTNFTLKNTKGDTVDLASLKGKTVVLDFWATWCGPCKAAFPGMQMAVDKYKDDDTVVFLFIDTMESGDFETRSKLAANFVKNNNYTFEVVIDNPKEEGSREFLVASNFEVTGIPTKVIIGPDGNIKFISVGYSGSIDKLVKELSLKIDLLNS